jgi:hypothetical protein
MIIRKTFTFILLLLIACNRIQTGDTLSETDIDRIRKINLLDQDERINKIYSEFKNEVAGNFFTNKRLAKYWIDERDKTINETSSGIVHNCMATEILRAYTQITNVNGRKLEKRSGTEKLQWCATKKGNLSSARYRDYKTAALFK